MSVRFDPNRRLIAVVAHLYGPSGDAVVRLALDTGASSSVINESMIRLIGHDPASAVRRIRITTGSGVISAPCLSIDRLEALGHTRRDFSIICHTLPPSASVDGVLGLDFFRDQRLTIDFRAGLILLE